jgi:hypothetical protein
MGTKIGLTGITFGDATVQNTAATTGVTSLTAGTGISVSGATGAVTVSATGGGVTSVNGQTGAVVLTNAGDIGSIGVFQNSGTSDLAYGSTIAGSTLRHGETNNSSSPQGQAPFFFFDQRCNAFYGAGGTALSGTWRKLNTGSIFTSNSGCGNTTRNYMRALYIRVS